MSIKDAFELFVKIFHRHRAELMEDTPHFDPVVGVRIASIEGRYEQPIRLCAERVQVRRVVMAVPQHEADIGGNFAQQGRSRLTISDIGGSQHGSQRKPDRCDD
jgi:hypothetical protein